ncbi:hypothetical protein [Alkalilimnicola ehrlichii]|uniref:hypothetical protein n=1 Tax=Alkalilimnicola ehrlichii TaxID=351052 RepID=UPI001C6F561E|nr:hypothetical protein [Alkalilimnicola ehrlichii]
MKVRQIGLWGLMLTGGVSSATLAASELAPLTVTATKIEQASEEVPAGSLCWTAPLYARSAPTA